MEKKLEVYVSYYKKYYIYENDIFKPYYVGNISGKNNIGLQGDDTGINISEKNETFNELTLIYWVWKNTEQDYVGFSHYRRYFIYGSMNKIRKAFYFILNKMTSKQKFKEQKINKILDDFSRKINLDIEKFDIILPKPIIMPRTLKEQYGDVHYIEHYEKMGKVIEEKHPKIYKNYLEASNKNTIYIANMFIFKREIFNEYCKFLFDIMFELEKEILVPNDSYQKRVFGYLSERLLTIYIDYLSENFDYKFKYLDILNTDLIFKNFKNYMIEKKEKKNSNKITNGYVDFLSKLGEESYFLSGWGIVNDEESSDYNINIELYNSKEIFFYSTESSFRNDVTLKFSQINKNYYNYDASGFNTIINIKNFKIGKYKIKIVFDSRKNNTRCVYYVIDSFLEIQNNKKMILKRVK